MYSRYLLYIAVLACLLARGNGGRTVIIPETSSVIEHTPLRLDCFYKDYSALPTTTTCRWSIVENGTTTRIAYFYENCLFKNTFEEIYSFECTNKTANSMIIKSTDRNLHGTVFSCSYYVNGTTATGYSTVNVSGNGVRTVIVPETISVIEHTHLRLDCFYKDYSALPATTTCRWSTVRTGTTTGIAVFYENCLFRNTFEEIYSFECTNKTANSLIIKSTHRNLHGTVFSCSYFVNGINATGYSTIHVIVPASSVKLTQPESGVVITTENRKVTFTCNASAAQPKPIITWYNDSKTPLNYRDDVEIPNDIKVLFDNDGYLYTVISTLTFYPAKYDNGSHIYCNASNIERQSISSTRKALLYVHYPPSTPTFFTRSNVSVQKLAVIIYNTLMIRCKSSGNPFPSYIWTTSQNKEVPGEDLSIENIKQTEDGMYSCMAYNSFIAVDDKTIHNTSASIEVTVLYPPDYPKLYNIRSSITEEIFSSTLIVVKEDYVRILCNSTGKPAPVSGWNGAKSSDTLSLKSIEADTNYTCTSSNLMTETEGETRNGIASRKIKIHVLYPPGTPIITIHHSEDYIEALDLVNVVENANISLECSAESKPPSNFSWSPAFNEINKNSSNCLILNRILRNQSGTFTCHATNEMVRSFGNVKIGKNNRSTFIDVLYSPDIPTFNYLDLGSKHKITTLPLKVVEGDNVSVLCHSTGNPTPTSVWMHNAADTDILSIVSVEINHQTNITCKSFNMMNDTFGISRKGTSSNNVSLIVFHPPRIPVIHIQLQTVSTKEAVNYTGILEGSYFRLYCNAVSNPSPSYRWTGPVTSNHMSNSEELFISNIQRNQSGPYICYAQNEMERSFGNTETGRNNQSIYFDILYEAAIKYFGSADFENNKNMMTVEQSKETRVICRVEGDPCANSTIYFKGRIVNETICNDTVFYNLVNTSCSDAGRYICKGKNEYNYETDANKELFVYVKCPPQPSADHPPEKNISAALLGSAVFRFHAAPYYDPGITQFRWFKQENDSRISLQNGTKAYIISTGIHSVLRINDLSEADYGMYILEYSNSVGTNNFTFYLQQKDQTEEIHQRNDKNYLSIVIGIVIAVLAIAGVTLGIVIFIRRYKRETDNGNRSYDNICVMNAKSGENTSINSPVYEGLKPNHERGYLEMKEQAYDILTPTKDSVETNDPVYTNLKL